MRSTASPATPLNSGPCQGPSQRQDCRGKGAFKYDVTGHHFVLKNPFSFEIRCLASGVLLSARSTYSSGDDMCSMSSLEFLPLKFSTFLSF